MFLGCEVCGIDVIRVWLAGGSPGDCGWKTWSGGPAPKPQTMIDAALRLVAGDLNAWFRRRRNAGVGAASLLGASSSVSAVAYPPDPVVVSQLVDADGAPASQTEEKVVMSVSRICEERNVGGAGVGGGVRRGGDHQVQTAPIFLDVHVLVAARFRQYDAGLGILSEVIGLLQGKPVFTRENTPLMGEGLERLTFTMLKLDYGEQNHLWGCLGAKYSPSVVYSMRLLPIGRERVRELVPVVQEPVLEAAGGGPP